MSKFDEWAPRMMRDLLAEPHFGLTPEDAAAIVGNGAYESAGFSIMQEMKPTIPGSRGGYGAFQWTGPRRRAFEAWAKRKGWSVDSYEANYSFLIRELLTTEKKAIPAVKNATSGLDAKTRAFEAAYERAGVKAYAKRIAWAQKCLAAYQGEPEKPEPLPVPVPPPDRWPQYIIEAVQRRLAILGYQEVGAADGFMGPKTLAAMQAFQDIEQLPRTVEIDEATIRRLGSALPVAGPKNAIVVVTKPEPEPAPKTEGNRSMDTAWMVIRYLLIAGFSFLASRGYMTEEQGQTIVGAVGTIIPILWGIFVKSGTVPVKASIVERQHLPHVSSATGSTKVG